MDATIDIIRAVAWPIATIVVSFNVSNMVVSMAQTLTRWKDS
jgi:hypothetical protein